MSAERCPRSCGMLSAITAECCPPSAWNRVRDRAEYAAHAALGSGVGFTFNQILDMGRLLDLLVPVIGTRMASQYLLAIHNAQALLIGQHRQHFAHGGMWHRVVVEVKAHIGCLADLDFQAFLHRIGVDQQGQQVWFLQCKGLGDRERFILRAQPRIGLTQAATQSERRTYRLTSGALTCGALTRRAWRR